MPMCELGFDHPEPEPETVVVEEPAVEAAAVANAEADVAIAEINAAADVERAKINAKVEAGWQEARVVELEGKLAGMAEVLDRLTAPPPEPGPETIVVDPPAPEPEPDITPAPPETAPPTAPKKSKGWF